MDSGYCSWELFNRAEYFTDPLYNVLPPKDLAKIKPLTRENSNKLWNVFIGPDYKGWYTITNDSGLGDKMAIRHIPASWDRAGKKVKDRTKVILKNLINQPKEIPILFFWNRETAAVTHWGIFLKYWQDFCLGVTNEGIVVFLTNDLAVHYIDCPDNFAVVNRFREFGAPVNPKLDELNF